MSPPTSSRPPFPRQSLPGALLGALLAFALAAGSPSPAGAQEAQASDAPRVYAALGVGLPEVVHITAGVYTARRYSIDIRAGALVYSPVIGVGISRYLRRSDDPAAGATPYLSADVRYNPDYSAGTVEEEIQWGTTVSAGYRTNRLRGFFVDARLTGWLFGSNRGLGGSVSFAAGLGWAF